MKDEDSLLSHIYAVLNREIALADLKPKKISGYYEVICPKCAERSSFIYANGVQIICNRKNSCGHEVTIWDYVKAKGGFTQQETMQELARLAGIPIKEMNSEALQGLEKTNIIKSAMAFYKAQMKKDYAKEAHLYLKSRGYSEEEILNLELGFNPSYAITKEYLLKQGYKESDISDALKFLPYRDDYKIVFPYRDFNGIFCSLWGRVISSSKEKGKYKPFTTEAPKSSPFNLDRARGVKEIIVVEGFLDAMVATEKGVKGVVALGGSCMTPAHLESIQRLSLDRLFLCLDSDDAGQKGTEEAVKDLAQAGIDAFVISLPDGYKDPDEFLVKSNATEFQSLIKKAVNGAKWLAERVVKKHDAISDVGHSRAITEAASCLTLFKNDLYKKIFTDSISEALEISPDLLCKTPSTVEIKDTAHYRFSHLFDGLTKEDIKKEMASISAGASVGLTLGEMDLILPGGAITIVAGATGHGKTTVLINLMLNYLELNPTEQVWFFSYEQSRADIFFLFLNAYVNKNFSKNNRRAFKAIYADKEVEFSSSEDRSAFLSAEEKFFKEFMETKRLNIVHQIFSTEELVEAIRCIKKDSNVGLVAIDYMQLLNASVKKTASRQEELKQVCLHLKDCAIATGLPLLIAAQFNRTVMSESDLNLLAIGEAGDIERIANLVIGIWNKNCNSSEIGGNKKESSLYLKILKSREMGFGHSAVFEFNGNTGKLFNICAERTVLRRSKNGK